ncbi:hypothetical protein NL108_004695 [Boleophthalmus pectinirostris]|nr:hypothetical protein NL108_004695 [Boleophthalmus pectinirostris]
MSSRRLKPCPGGIPLIYVSFSSPLLFLFLSSLCSQDLKKVLSFPQYPGEFLHPVVYACTAVMLLCLFASIITYIVHHR